jgi:hypothetical protein
MEASHASVGFLFVAAAETALSLSLTPEKRAVICSRLTLSGSFILSQERWESGPLAHLRDRLLLGRVKFILPSRRRRVP